MNKTLTTILALLIGMTAVAVSSPTHAKQPVDVELVFLVDASNSIDQSEIKLQRQGYASALVHPQVQAAIARGAYRKIAVTFIEWGDEDSLEIVVPWTLIDGLASAQAFSKRLLAAPRMAFGSNAIGSAIAKGQTEIESNAFEGFRKVIDLSADSANNWSGIPIEDARKKAIAAGITINGLAVLCRDTDCSGRPNSYDLEEAFKRTIIGGPGSFVVTVENANSFTAAVRRKLILELAALPL